MIYISGTGRSGSTLLDRVLGTLDGVSSYNEMRPIWRFGFGENQPCACGAPFLSCPFWSAVSREAFDGEVDWQRMATLEAALDQSRYFLFLLRGRVDAGRERDLTEYRETLGRLYRAIAVVSGDRVIIDSSKVPTRALILSQIPGFDVHLIHLVRDIRAIVYAWSKEEIDPSTGRPRARYTSTRTVFFWMMRNLLAEGLAARLPYQRVRYEDLVRSPRSVLQPLVDAIPPIAEKRLPFTDEHTITLGALHAVAGSPGRFRSGPTTLRLDEEWRRKLPAATRWMATLAGWPLLARYGYL